MIKFWTCFLISFGATLCFSQRNLLNELVTVHYEQVVLEDALIDISQKYKFSFAYSKDMVSLDQPISILAKSQPLHLVLDDLFKIAAIQYTQIGDQIVLKFDKSEFKLISQKKKRKTQRKKTEKVTIIRKAKRVNKKVIVPVHIVGTRLKEISFVPKVIYVSDKLILPKVKPLKFETSPSIEELQDKDAKIVVAFTPTISSDRIINTDSVVNLSLNIIAGSVPNVEGAQIGTISNRIEGDLSGVQVALGVNTVGNDMMGTQVSLFRNHVKGRGYGAQITLGSNKIENINGAQIALFNNRSIHDADLQIAIFRNKAENSNLQIGLLNRSKKNAKFQIGLINSCDSISGLSIGLLNFVRHGNNYFEYAYSYGLKHNFSLKFGGYKLYNILKYSIDKNKKILGVGYGLGNAIKLSPYWSIDLELIGQYLLREGQNLTELNLLNSLNLDLDLKLFSRMHLFGGFRLNTTILETKLENQVDYKYEIAPEKIIFSDKIGAYDKYDLKAWFDTQFGIRFYLTT